CVVDCLRCRARPRRHTGPAHSAPTDDPSGGSSGRDRLRRSPSGCRGVGALLSDARRSGVTPLGGARGRESRASGRSPLHVGDEQRASEGGCSFATTARRVSGGLRIRADQEGMFPGTRGLTTARSAAAPRKISTPTTTIHDQSRMVLQPIATPPVMAPTTTVNNSRTYCPIISCFPLLSSLAPSAASRATRLRCASDGERQEQAPCPHHEGSAWAIRRKPSRDLTRSGAAARYPLPMELTRFST